VVPLALVVSCTAEPARVAVGTAGAVRATAVTPGAPVTVLDAAPGADTAIATSAALFRSAPVVVVGEEDGAAAAGTLGTRLHAPVLLAPEGDAAAFREELRRLSPTTVVAVGRDARRAAAAGGGPVRVVAAGEDGAVPRDLPEVARPRPAAVTVLADPERDEAAAVATARAAGARVVPVRGGDPRADAEAAEALRADPPGTVLALGEHFGPAERLRTRLAVATGGTRLPGGGQVVFPGRRFVCLYGHPGTPSLGVLGEQDVTASVARAKALAAEYAPLSDVPVVPAFEIIATVARGEPGPDGDFSGETSVAALRPWVDAAGEAGLYVVLDLQPGRARLVDQARLYEPLLALPHVGLAVDPEWKLAPDQVPLRQIGGVDAAEVNEVMAWLAGLTARHALPQKLFVVHQFKLSMIRDARSLVTTHDELALLVHMDGQGTTGQKVATWRAVVGAHPAGLPMGWKNFYDEDHPMLTPAQTMTHEPTPLMISYQ
jgi:hypothetical protein